MNDLFKEKSRDWDAREMSQIISSGVGAALLDNVPFTADMQVMDFGAGTGLICAQVAPLVKRVYAVDISSAMLERLAEKSELQGKVETICQDIVVSPMNKTFDVIMSAMSLHHVEDTELLLNRFHEYLKPGGQIALADLDQENGTFHPEDVQGVFHHGFDREALQALLEATGFEEVRFVTALEVSKEEKTYPVFLVTARRQ